MGNRLIFCIHYFLGGLSLHLNHLLSERLVICNRQFETRPIMVIFDICPLLMAPGPFEYFSKWVPSENQRYLDNGATGPTYSVLA